MLPSTILKEGIFDSFNTSKVSFLAVIPKVLMLKNGVVTEDGLKLGASLPSAQVFRFKRFSTKVNIAIAFDVDCSVVWKTATTSTATESYSTDPVNFSDKSYS